MDDQSLVEKMPLAVVFQKLDIQSVRCQGVEAALKLANEEI